MEETNETGTAENRDQLFAKLEQINQQLQSERKASKLKLVRHKFSSIVGYFFLSFGIIALASAIIYDSPILAFTGLGLTLWGGLFLFVKPVRYAKANLLNSTVISSLTTINKILTELKYQGQGIYLPPRHLRELKEGVVFVPIRNETVIPQAEDVAKGKMFMNPNGICFTPPGQGLLTLYEKELGTDLSKANLSYLRNKLPKLLVENLEILEDLEINEQDDKIYVKMNGSVYEDLCNNLRNNTDICSRLGCPLCSSIACALAKVTGKAVAIERTELSTDRKTVETWYSLIED